MSPSRPLFLLPSGEVAGAIGIERGQVVPLLGPNHDLVLRAGELKRDLANDRGAVFGYETGPKGGDYAA